MKTALYARFSTDRQSEHSIEDQFRTAAEIAARHGLTVVARFSDAAQSGGTTARPGYQQLVATARAGKVQAIVAEDVSRLWRSLSEQSARLAEFADLGIIVVTHDLDTRQDSAGLLGAMTGAAAEQYRREVGRRTFRGLNGRARAGKSTGGRAYGYLSVSESGTGQREIERDEAKVVRRIFSEYANGRSLPMIVAGLNREGVALPRNAVGSHAAARAGLDTDFTRFVGNARYPQQRDLRRPRNLEPLQVEAFGAGCEAPNAHRKPAERLDSQRGAPSADRPAGRVGSREGAAVCRTHGQGCVAGKAAGAACSLSVLGSHALRRLRRIIRNDRRRRRSAAVRVQLTSQQRRLALHQ